MVHGANTVTLSKETESNRENKPAPKDTKAHIYSTPPHVPSDVDWARFRLDGKKRLIGFTIPKSHCRQDSRLDDNTFYIVFLDLEHNFYQR